MTKRRCELCGREFDFDQALLQHYTAKHPQASPPKDLVKKKDTRYKKRSPAIRKTLFTIIVALIIASSIGVYSYANNTRRGSPDTQTNYGINVGDYAPNIPITLINGTKTSLSAFSGHYVLLYFVVTWCSSCIQAAALLNQQYYPELHSKGVVILVVELYNDLNVLGPSLQQFANQYGGGTGKPGWFYGTSTQSATHIYDPNAYLEAYYLINPKGVIVINTGSTSLAYALPSIVNAV